MSKLPLAIVGIIVIVLGVIASSALFTVDQREQVIVLQFGEPTRVIREPGLNFKLPFIQNVVYFDSRVLSVDLPSDQMVISSSLITRRQQQQQPRKKKSSKRGTWEVRSSWTPQTRLLHLPAPGAPLPLQLPKGHLLTG